MRRCSPSGKRRGRFAVGTCEADSDSEDALAYSTDSGAEENEDPIIGPSTELGNAERKRVRELLRRFARGDVEGRGTVGANEDDGDDSDEWVVDDRNENVRFNGRGEVEVYGPQSLATGPFRAPRKSASRWHPVRPFAQTQPVSSSSLGPLRQPTVARKTSSTSNPRQGMNGRGHRANIIPEQQTFASQQQPRKKLYACKSAPSIGSHAEEHTAREKTTSSSHPRPNPTEGNITIFIEEAGDISAQIEGRESGKSGNDTRLFGYPHSEEDGDLNEIPGRTKRQVRGAQSQASFGQSSLPEQEFGADIQRAIELSLRETDPVASPPLPQTTLPQSSVPGPSLTPAAGPPMFGPWQNIPKQYYSRHAIYTERLAPPVRRTRTENDTRASLRAWDRGTSGERAAGDEPIGARNTPERNSKRDRAIYENGTGDTTEDDDCIPPTQDSRIKRVRGSSRSTPKDDTNKDEHFGHKDFQGSENKRPRVTIEDASGNTTEDDEPFGHETPSRPVTRLAGRRTRYTACDKCWRNKRRCTHARSDQKSLEPGSKDTSRKNHPACPECRKAHRRCIHAKSEGERLGAGVQETGRKIGGKDGLNQTTKVRGRETENASLESRDSSGDTTEIDESFRTKKVKKKATNTNERKRAARKDRGSSGVTTGNDLLERVNEIRKTKKTAQAAKVSRGDDEKAEEIPVLYPAGQPPPKVTATRTEIRTEAFQKKLREEAGQVHHTYDPAKTNPIDRHYRSVTSMSTHSTNMPPRLERTLAERVRSPPPPPPPPPQAQVQPPQARPTYSAFQRTARLLELASTHRSQCRQQPIQPQIADGAVRREEMANSDNLRTRQVTEPRVRNEAIEGVERRDPRTGSAPQETEEQMERDSPADYWSRIAEEDPYARYQ
ncbi:MAG: hypothetical protein M1836_003195 [Candelina mexicana]|nr:MAG: hypothetical protein M1836_003195 [Candelina mexicana]